MPAQRPMMLRRSSANSGSMIASVSELGARSAILEAGVSPHLETRTSISAARYEQPIVLANSPPLSSNPLAALTGCVRGGYGGARPAPSAAPTWWTSSSESRYGNYGGGRAPAVRYVRSTAGHARAVAAATRWTIPVAAETSRATAGRQPSVTSRTIRAERVFKKRPQDARFF